MKTVILTLAAASALPNAFAADPDFTPEPEAILKRELKREPPAGFAPMQPSEDVRQFVEHPEYVIDSIPAMELLKGGTTPHQPWAGHAWALKFGQVGRRYADSGFPANDDWKVNYDYAHFVAPAENLLASRNIDALSPAEKYDLLVDPSRSFKFSEINWEEGGRYYREQGKVDGWMGICHGTSAAAIEFERPTNTVVALAADGRTKIKFYPSDIKGLTALFWAFLEYDSKYVGLRCNAEVPQRRNGRIQEPECFDTNAGSFHLTMVNQIGLFKKALVMDRSPFVEVWNHPVFGYQYEYFNPITKKQSDSADLAIVKASDHVKDPFRKYRSPGTKYLLGVRFFSTYRSSMAASTRGRVTAANEPQTTKKYVYDLELDENFRIIGGEWYQAERPDFLWRPALKTEPYLDVERTFTTQWDMRRPLPAEWQEAAKGAIPQKKPLYSILKELVRASRMNASSSDLDSAPSE